MTSSNASIGGVCTGLGVGPRVIGAVLGVAKAYTTRVGEGPLPTELFGEMGNRLRESGHEYGAVTGRPRRCGWYDAVAIRYSVRINGLDALALTKLDVLDGLDHIDICTAYRCGGQTLTQFPSDIARLLACEPVYETMPGWSAADAGPATLRRPAASRPSLRGAPRGSLGRAGGDHLDRLGTRRHDSQRRHHCRLPVASRRVRRNLAIAVAGRVAGCGEASRVGCGTGRDRPHRRRGIRSRRDSAGRSPAGSRISPRRRPR